jgi:hypothetical protein
MALLLGRSRRGLSALLLIVVLSACSWEEPPNPDPRAYAGADSGVTLDDGLADHGLVLPVGVADVGFGAFSGREYSFYLDFDVACSSVPSFLVASSVTAPLEAGVVPSLVYSASLHRGWDVKSFGNPRGIEEDVQGVLHRSVLVVDVTTARCRVFVSSFK